MVVLEYVGYYYIMELEERANDSNGDVEKKKRRKTDSLIVMPGLDIIALLYIMLTKFYWI